MKRIIALCIAGLFMLICAFAEGQDTASYMPEWSLRSHVPTEAELFSEFGSFTYLPCDSFDGMYRAELQIEKRNGDKATMVYLTITDTETSETIAEIRTERAYDFWGICWDKSSYDIYVQSADVGLYTLKYNDGAWIKKWDADIPDYIITRRDVLDMKQRIEELIGKTPDELSEQYPNHAQAFQLGYIKCEDGFIEYEKSINSPHTIIAAAGFTLDGVLLYNAGMNLVSAELFDSCSPTTYKELIAAFGYGYYSGASGLWSAGYLIDDGRIAGYFMISNDVNHDYKIQAVVNSITDWDELVTSDGE